MSRNAGAVHVFRADEHDAVRVFRILTDTGLAPQLERYGPTVYVVVGSSRPDIVALALSGGDSVRQILDLEELQGG